ncbi:RES domain-containing protein [Mesorhizobium sp. M7A.F.Ca.US.011.01.1.1]|uniref:RES family NAD+ phosphorylase n=1 Tax=Mesorhizobium sp. M7A.F.Ca.US.011.01.1.1 TaxID=2496741 RepID=UPI000FCB8E94|nr:RES family NAD+ phosphorylase [Mesorhizobium sp. M7A.F.Ca.US.011.01.1.1]RUX25198.1 RES domain-containing protein [Mesorhizobium sp. M7A.F.Ca.US.011.01.1.1]
MRLWRLLSLQFAEAFDGGYGLRFDGRWNTVGRPLTYAATSPSLCVLEKLVHVEDPELLPALAMLVYEVSDEMPVEPITLADLPEDWRRREAETQRIGDEWLASNRAAILFIPSAIVSIADSPDQNVIINHRHPATAGIRIERIEAFDLDVRLL